MLLRAEVGERQRLVGAGVQGADDHAAAAERREHLAVDLGLLARGWGRLVGAEEEHSVRNRPDALDVLGAPAATASCTAPMLASSATGAPSRVRPGPELAASALARSLGAARLSSAR